MNIPCEVILDLIPLVRDGASSEEAKKMVEDHVAQCVPCRGEYEGYSPKQQNKLTDADKKVLSAIHTSIIVSKFVAVGAILIICLAAIAFNYQFYLYNYFLILAIGVISYYLFQSRRWILPIAVFATTLLWLGIDMLQRGASMELGSMWWLLQQSLLYAGLAAAGIFAGFLFRYAFSSSSKKKGEDLNESK